MSWEPNTEGVKELITIFKESKGNNNRKHREIAEKINTYSKTKQFTNYLVYILNNKDIELGIRQISGLTLKGVLERQFYELDECDIEYFKKNICKCYLDEQPVIRKAITNILNTFIRIGGIEMWPEILNILHGNLDNLVGVTMSLETLNILIEDSGIVLEEKYVSFLRNLTHKLTNFIENITSKEEKEADSKLVALVLSTVYILLEKCSSSMVEHSDKIAMVLINLQYFKNASIRYKIGRCLLTILKVKQDLLVYNRGVIFSFFCQCLYVESYEMNFIACEFFLMVVEDDKGKLMKNQEFSSILKSLLPYFLHYTKLTSNDMYSLDVENKDFCIKNKLAIDGTDGIDDFDELAEELDEEGSCSYNPDLTLRKCCSKLLDKLSLEFPQIIFDVLRPYLETDMRHKDWVTKERSILVFGAIGVGQYESIKPHLNIILRFLIGEMVHPNKLVRAISCWTLSRFYNFLINDNSSKDKDELFRLFLSELVKRFLDKDSIVQEAAFTAFNSLIQLNKEKITPYFAEILKIISSVLEEYQGSSLLALYDTIILLTENYQDQFKNLDIIMGLLTFVMKKWYHLIKNLPTPQSSGENFLSTDVANVVLFDLLSSIIRACGSSMENYLEDFIEGSLRLLRFYSDDKDIVCKSLDLISVLCQVFTEKIKKSPNKFKIVEEVFRLIQHDNDISTKQYVLALIGDLCRVDPNLLSENINPLIEILTNHIQVLDFKNCRSYMNLIYVCNNSCWTLGILAITFKDKLENYVEGIMEAMLKIIKAPKLNKALAQNISICIGRLSLASPQKVANYIQYFIKQFCMSLKTAEDSIEKQEAFEGVCKAIILNPQGVLHYFAFFCDVVCLYDNAPVALEYLFQNIILSYKNSLGENWYKLFDLFPEKLKNRMNVRFSYKIE